MRKDGKNEGTSGDFSVGSGKAKTTRKAPRTPAIARRKRKLSETELEEINSVQAGPRVSKTDTAAVYPSPPKSASHSRSRQLDRAIETDSDDDLPPVEELLTPSKKRVTRGLKVATYQSDGEEYDSAYSDFTTTA